MLKFALFDSCHSSCIPVEPVSLLISYHCLCLLSMDADTQSTNNAVNDDQFGVIGVCNHLVQ